MAVVPASGKKPPGDRAEVSSTEDRVGRNGGWSSGSVVNEAPQSIGATVDAEDQRVERELVARCLAGAQSAAREFVERYQSVVYGVCLRMLADVQDAEDAAQETFVRALRALERWDGERPIRPWLLTIAANRCRTYLSRRPKRAVTCEFPEEIADGRPDSQMQADASELSAAIRSGLASLRDDYREAFLLYHEQGLSYAEISATLAKPVGTLKTWLHRARNELLSYLKRQGHAAEIERDDTGV